MNFKTGIRDLERLIRQKKQEREKTIRLEAKSRKNWTKVFHTYTHAVDQLINLKIHGTKKEVELVKKIKGWPAKSIALTKERDSFRTRVTGLQDDLTRLAGDLALIAEQQNSELKTIDEIVIQVFSLNKVAVEASKNRENYLTHHIFPRLFDENGNLRSQVSFTSSDGLSRVVAMVNSITLVQGDMASRAMEKIQVFFDYFQKVTPMDVNVKGLYDLTRQLLVEKTSFKVGPDLYRFLGMELDADIFPELAEAQRLLRQSIRSEKTTSYIRIYERKSRADGWEVVRQS